MRVVYADAVIVMNLAADYIILLLTARICAAEMRRMRIFLGALAGAFYALAAELWPFLAGIVPKLAAGVLMLLIAFGTERRFLRLTLVFLGVSAAFAGVSLAVSLMAGGSAGGVLIAPLDIKVLLVCFGLGWAVFSIIGSRMARVGVRETVPAVIGYKGKTASVTLLIDTGSSLRDPVTNRPVVVVDRTQVSRLLPAEVADALSRSRDPTDAMQRLGGTEYAHILRLIPYSAVGVEGGLLPAFLPDTVTVGGKPRSGTLVALSPTPVSDGAPYSGIIGT